jgi:hypothetical protein
VALVPLAPALKLIGSWYMAAQGVDPAQLVEPSSPAKTPFGAFDREGQRQSGQSQSAENSLIPNFGGLDFGAPDFEFRVF